MPSQCLAQPMAMSLAVVRSLGEQAVFIMGQTSRCCMVCKERPGKTELKMRQSEEMAKVTPINSVLTQKRLSWYGHVMRRDETHTTKSTLRTTVTGTRPRGRPKMRWLDRLKSDTRIYSINPEMATDRKRWSVMVKNVDTT